MTCRTFREGLITTVEIGTLRNYCSCKVHHETKTLGIEVFGELDNELKRYCFYQIKNLLKDLDDSFTAFVDKTDLRANKFTKYLGLQLESEILGYNKFVWLNQ